MKKYIFIAAVMFIGFAANAQKRTAAEKNECYIESATSTFDLSEEKKEELTTLLTEKEESRADIFQKIKKGEMSKDEGKKQAKGLNRGYINKFTKLVGKPKKEVIAFMKEVGKNCR